MMHDAAAFYHQQFQQRNNVYKMRYPGAELAPTAKTNNASRGRSALKGRMSNGGRGKEWHSSSGSRLHHKSAVDIFLADEGPYSRRLYGPPPPETQLQQSADMIDMERKKRTRSHEQLRQQQHAEVGYV